VKIVAVGSPKGGVGKTTTAVTVATIAAKSGHRVLLIDGDANQSAVDWCQNAGDEIPLDVSPAPEPEDLRKLTQLRTKHSYDLAVVDLPGARAGAFEAMLTGAGRRPVADLLVVPTTAELMDLRPVLRVMQREVLPLRVPYLMVLKADPLALSWVTERRAELRDTYGLAVADTIIREYVIYREALERSRTVLDVGGAHSYARHAEADYRAVTSEVAAAVGLSIAQPVEV